MQSIRGRLARGALWIGLTRLFVSVIGFGSTLVLARLLTPDDFGIVAIATTILTIVGSVTELSLSAALVQHNAPDEEHFHTAFTLNGMRAVIIAVALSLAAWPIAGLYADPRLGPVILVVAMTGLLSGFFNPKLVVMTRDLVFWQEFALNVSQKLTGFVVAAVIALAYQSYWALILGSSIAQLLNLVLSYAVRPYRPRFGLGRARELFSFSIWLSLGQGVNALNWNLDKLVVGYIYGQASLGTYTVGDNLAALPTREATLPIAQTLFPGFSRMVDDPERLRRAYLRAQRLLCAIAFPIGFGFAAAAPIVVPLTLGPQWAGATIVIQVIASVIALQTLATTLQPLAMALGQTQLLFGRDLVNLFIRVPLMALGMFLGGFPGILFGRAGAAAVGTVINMHLVQQLTGLSLYEQIAGNIRPLASSVAMVGVILALQSYLAETSLGVSTFTTLTLVGAAGAATFATSAVLLWFMARCPDGPEREISEALRYAVGRAVPLIFSWRSSR
nr:lipopolysaccharide biosynthesis protein [Microvirga sp. BSC39]